MKNIKYIVSLFVLGWVYAFPAMAQVTEVKMTSAAEAGAQLSFTVNTSVEPYLVDWGDGKKISYECADSVAYLEIKGNLAGKEITVSNAGQWFMLDCSNNQLTTIQLDQAKNLRSLYCAHNELDVLDVRGMTQLVELNCSHNNITKFELTDINNVAADLPLLENLNISYNQFAGSYMFRFPSLQYLKANNNKFTKFYIYDTQLHLLDVSNNVLEGFLTLPKCEELDNVNFSGNKIRIATLFNKGQSVRQLIGDGNQLKKIDLSAAKNLSTLSISDNLLQSCLLPANDSINSLNVASNKLLFNMLPAQEKAPRYLAFEPQDTIDYSQVAGLEMKDGMPFVALAENWADRHNKFLDLSYYSRLSNDSIDATATFYAVDAEGVETPLKRCESEGEGDYYEEDGKIAFFKHYPMVYGKLTSRTYGVSIPTAFIIIGDEPTGISGQSVADTALQVSAIDGVLVLRCAMAKPVSVFNVEGKLCWCGTVDGTVTLHLPKGVYIVNHHKVAL